MKTRLRLTSPVIAAAKGGKWDPAKWQETTDAARIARMERKIAAAKTKGEPQTTHEMADGLRALLARTAARERTSRSHPAATPQQAARRISIGLPVQGGR